MSNEINMTKTEFNQIYRSKGWTPLSLSQRWGFSHQTRIYQIAADPTKNPYYIDAVKGLPDVSSNSAGE